MPIRCGGLSSISYSWKTAARAASRYVKAIRSSRSCTKRAGPSACVTEATPGNDGTARACFVVDASGQAALLGRRLNLRRWDPFFRNLAVYGYVTGADRLPAPDETNIFIEAHPHGWSWTIPLHTGWTSVGTVMDSLHGQERLSKGELREVFLRQVTEAPHTARLLRDAELVSGPQVVKDWSYTSERLVGDGYILIGDAACFVDPLFSSGVHSGADVRRTGRSLRDAPLSKTPAWRKQRGRSMGSCTARNTTTFAPWPNSSTAATARRTRISGKRGDCLGDSESLSPRHAFIHAVAGQSPRGYERVVLEQGEAPERFTRNVRAVESARTERRGQLEGSGAPQNMFNDVPRLAPGVAVKRKPVLGAGEFVWGHVLITDGYPEGTPCSPLAAQVVSLIDGRTPVAGLLERLCAGRNGDQRATIVPAALQTLRIL